MLRNVIVLKFHKKSFTIEIDENEWNDRNEATAAAAKK